MTALDPDQTVGEIGQKVIDGIGIPKDRWEITAQLEVLGLRDSDARNRFGSNDLFEMADHILALFREGKLEFEVEGEDAEPGGNRIFRFVRHYLDGLMFSLPMVLQGLTMLIWGYGLWGALELDALTGSSIALGFIASYVATSGFSWAIVRRGLFYFYQNEGGLARWSALRMWWLSVRVVLALIVPALLFNILYGALPSRMFFLALAYYVALSILWLNWALIYLVRRAPWLLAALALSILLVVLAVRGFGWPIVAANMLGLAAADLLTFGIALRGLDKLAGNGAAKPTVNPPRLTVLIYSTAQTFLYGFLYSLFVFADRVLAWTSSRGREDFPPYAFWLNARYELGMDLALVVVVLLSGVVEYSTQQFSRRLVPSEKKVMSTDLQPFLKDFRSFYRRHVLLLGLGAVTAVTSAFFAAELLRRLASPRMQESLASGTTTLVLWVAAISYAVFMFALQSILILLTLSRADLAVRAIAISLGINIVVGFALSRSVHYSAAVFGLLAGSISLALLGHRHLRRAFAELDYVYYAAY